MRLKLIVLPIIAITAFVTTTSLTIIILISLYNSNHPITLPLCQQTLLGPIKVMSHYDPITYFDYNATVTNHTDFTWHQLVALHGCDMHRGGFYSPPSTCRAQSSVAFVVPLRDREQHLRVWLNHILPVLKRQQLAFKIYVVEQNAGEKFNRGLLLNIGFMQAVNDERRWSCVIFHDVDLLAEDDRALYVCETQPKHMSVAINKHNYKLHYARAMGGITAFTPDTFRRLNGFSNTYWGWGGEDDDMWLRIETLKKEGVHVVRPNNRWARYKMLKHAHNASDEEKGRFRKWKHTKSEMQRDGLSSLKYQVEVTEEHELFTRVKVVVHKRDYENVDAE